MRIANNLSALKTNNSLKDSSRKVGQLTEKLSSGYRINRSSDNAAGLTISEEMRTQIRGLDQASQNAQDGISLFQTAEGALSEIHNILQRINELSVQAANGTNTENDRSKIQEEVNGLVDEIDRTSSSTEFNGMKLLDGSMAENSTAHLIKSSSESLIMLQDLLDGPSDNLNLIYIDNSDNFEATQTNAGLPTISGYDNLKNVLQNEIVPQAVNSILNVYSPAFNYLSSSSLGIGLKLYSDPSSTALAAVSLGYYGGGEGNSVNTSMLTYQLSVNMSSLSFDGNGLITEESRMALETTIEHEMVHAFMDESLTNGMLGITNGVKDSSNSFPTWFVEGMAQTAAGGYANCNDWVNGAGGLGITTSTTQSSISAKVTNGSYSLNSGTTASKYATGYLACMYLGYLASGNNTISAGNISDGLGKVLSDLTLGKSLDTVIHDRSREMYASVSDFVSKFGDTASSSFIYQLTQIVGSTGNGGLATGNLLDSDLLPNITKATSLFELDTTNDTIKNIYPSDVNVLSGGGKTNAGTAPVAGYGSTIGDGSGPVINPGSVIDLSNISPVSGITYDNGLNVLTITNSGDYTLTGVNTTGVRVVVADGVTTNITLNNAKINTYTGAGISLEGSANVTLNLVGNNSVITSKEAAAGTRVTTGATLTIQGTGSLDTESTYNGSGYYGAGLGGGNGEDGGNIIINSGNITAISKGLFSAGIGGGEFGNGGNITINGGNVTAISIEGGSNTSSGAGIGGGDGGNSGNIVITGGNIHAISNADGAGIGGGCSSTSGGTIKITGGTVIAESKREGCGIGGGGQHGASGSIIITGGSITAKSARIGAGIGGYFNNNDGSITISGGSITAEGGYGAAGIGGCFGSTGGVITISGGSITAEGGNYGAGIGGGFNNNGGTININGDRVIVKSTGGGSAAAIGGGSTSGGSIVTGGTVNKTRGIIFEGSSGLVYGNVTLDHTLNCDGKTLTVQPGSTLTVSNSGRITNHGTFTNFGHIENHGAIGNVTGNGITHHYVTSIAKHIKEPTTASIGKSLADSITSFSPSSITVNYNGTARTLTGTWSVTDLDGNPITDLSGTIVGENDQYKYILTFTSQDNMFFDPSNISIYEMIRNDTQSSLYHTVSGEYLSALGPGGGGSILTYSYIVNSAPASVTPPDPSLSDIKGGIHIQSGANSGQSITFSIDSVKSNDLGIDNLSVLSHDDAETAIIASKKAINKISQIRSNLGAQQNRLEHTISNIDDASENLQYAESRIRDMDMADGIVEYSKYQILMQAGQAMLVQENQSPKSVLTLLL